MFITSDESFLLGSSFCDQTTYTVTTDRRIVCGEEEMMLKSTAPPFSLPALRVSPNLFLCLQGQNDFLAKYQGDKVEASVSLESAVFKICLFCPTSILIIYVNGTCELRDIVNLKVLTYLASKTGIVIASYLDANFLFLLSLTGILTKITRDLKVSNTASLPGFEKIECACFHVVDSLNIAICAVSGSAFELLSYKILIPFLDVQPLLVKGDLSLPNSRCLADGGCNRVLRFNQMSKQVESWDFIHGVILETYDTSLTTCSFISASPTLCCVGNQQCMEVVSLADVKSNNLGSVLLPRKKARYSEKIEELNQASAAQLAHLIHTCLTSSSTEGMEIFSDEMRFANEDERKAISISQVFLCKQYVNDELWEALIAHNSTSIEEIVAILSTLCYSIAVSSDPEGLFRACMFPIALLERKKRLNSIETSFPVLECLYRTISKEIACCESAAKIAMKIEQVLKGNFATQRAVSGFWIDSILL